jgi:hypothetical protein
MQGKYILLMLAHLFRKCGEQIELDTAVYKLSFVWRYGAPTVIRKILALAVNSEMISYSDGMIKAEFIFSSQRLDPNQADVLINKVKTVSNTDPLY